MTAEVCISDFTVDGILVDPQPVIVRLVTAEVLFRTTAGGYQLSIKRPGARRAVAQWGEDFLTLGAALAVRTLFPDDDPIHAVAWTELDGLAVAMNVTVEPVSVRWTQAQPGLIEALILTMWEIP